MNAISDRCGSPDEEGRAPEEPVEDRGRGYRSRRLLYWWRLVRQLPWLALRYRL